MKGMEEMTREEGSKIIGEILEEAKRYAPTYPPLTAYRVTYSDGSATNNSMASHVTLADAQAYYVGKWFNLGFGGNGENMQQAVSVEAIP
jgi:hypothetical protein